MLGFGIQPPPHGWHGNQAKARDKQPQLQDK